MAIRLYKSAGYNLRPQEEAQANKVISLLNEEYGDSEETVFVALDVIIGQAQIDMLLAKSTQFINVELKDFQGEIHGTPNGDWRAVQPNGASVLIKESKNPYRQVRDQRWALFDHLKSILPAIEPRFESLGPDTIACLIYFRPNSTFDNVTLEEPAKYWFRCVNESTFVDAFRGMSSRDAYFRESEISALFEKEGLQEVGPVGETAAREKEIEIEREGIIREIHSEDGAEYFLTKNSRRDIIVTYPRDSSEQVTIAEYNIATGKRWYLSAVRVPRSVWKKLSMDILNMKSGFMDLEPRGYPTVSGSKIRLYYFHTHGRDGISIAEEEPEGPPRLPRRVWFNLQSFGLLQKLITHLAN